MLGGRGPRGRPVSSLVSPVWFVVGEGGGADVLGGCRGGETQGEGGWLDSCGPSNGTEEA